MKKSVDFSAARRGPAVSNRGKTRITIYLDDEIIERFRQESERTGKGYQTLINDALTNNIVDAGKPLTAAQMRRILREELGARADG